MAKRNQPYSEIIDLEVELKEYKKLCRCKSKKYTYFLDWKKHILELYDGLDTSDKVINFKHYLINYYRVSNNIYEPYVVMMIFIYTTLLNSMKLWKNPYVLVAVLVVLSIIILIINDSQKKELCFVNDLIDIIKEYEEGADEQCPTPKPTTKKP